MHDDLEKLDYDALIAIAEGMERSEIIARLVEIQDELLAAGVEPTEIEGTMSRVCRSLNIARTEVRRRMN